MNIFKTRYVPWWETGLIKWSTFLIGIAAGAYWSAAFLPYILPIILVGLVIGIGAGVVWAKE